MSDFRYFTTQLYQSGSTPNPILAELPFTNVSFDAQMNSIGSFTGDILISGLDVINNNGNIISKLNVFNGTLPGKTALYVEYNGQLIWSGIIWQREWDSNTQMLKISGQEMLSYFKRRRIVDNITYTNTDPAVMANYLLTNYAQGKTHGNIGLQPSSTTTGLSVSRSYFNFELKEIYQAVKDLSDGLDSTSSNPFFDFMIRPSYDSNNRIINTLVLGNPYFNFNVSGVTAFNFPGNIVEYTFSENGSTATNMLYGLGYGANTNKVMAKAADDSTAYFSTYGIYGSISSMGNAALLEDSANFIDIADIGLLESTTLGQLNAVSAPPTTIQLVIAPYTDPYLGTFYVGDFVKLIINDDMFPNGFTATPPGTFNIFWRIVAISVAPGENGPSRVTVTLSQPIVNYGTVTQVSL